MWKLLLLLAALSPLVASGLQLERQPEWPPLTEQPEGQEELGLTLQPPEQKEESESEEPEEWPSVTEQPPEQQPEEQRQEPQSERLEVAKQNRSVLLVVAGLTRHFEATWPSIVQSLLEPNEARGYNFKIIFSTDTSLACGSQFDKWLKRRCEEKIADPPKHVAHIKEVFAPRHVKVVDHGDMCLNPGRREADPDLDDEDEESMLLSEEDARSMPAEMGAETTAGAELTSLNEKTNIICAPWFARVHRVVEEVRESGETFDHMVALRPDIIVHPAIGTAPRGEGWKPARMLLDGMCKRSPGFSFVTPSWTIPHRSSLHNRDLDFMHILCPGDKLDVYEQAIGDTSRGGMCYFGHGHRVPTIPAGFTNTKKWDYRAFMCRFVQLFNESNIPLGHWDDTFMCDWPSQFQS